jgi:hypothetical protein
VRVLHDADVVSECEQMVGPQARQVQVGDAGGPSLRRKLGSFLQDARCGLCDGRPCQRRTDPLCFGARRDQHVRLLDVAADSIGQRFRIAERHEQPGARSEHVLCVPVGRGNDGAARGDCEGERAGGDLLPAPVRRQEDVGCREQIRELVD